MATCLIMGSPVWGHLKPHEPHLQLLSQNLVVMSLETGPHVVSPHWSESLHSLLSQFSKFSALDMAQRLRGALKQNLRWQCTGRLRVTLYSRKDGVPEVRAKRKLQPPHNPSLHLSLPHRWETISKPSCLLLSAFCS